jgi:hypothetical protein
MGTLGGFRLDSKAAVVTSGGGAIGQVYGGRRMKLEQLSCSPTSTPRGPRVPAARSEHLLPW